MFGCPPTSATRSAGSASHSTGPPTRSPAAIASCAAAILAVGELTPDLGVERVQVAGVGAAARIFDLVDGRLEDLEGTVIAAARPTRPTRRGPGPTDGRDSPPPSTAAVAQVTAEVGPVAGPSGPRDVRLAGRIRVGRDWSEADQSLLDVFARLLRAAIDDASVHARALDRVDRLGRLARLQGDFLRGVSHNLQAPLTNIVVVSEELVTAERTDAHAREGALIIRAEADRLARLVGQLLTLSRLEAGTLRVEEEPVAPEPIIQRVWGSLGSDRPFRMEDRTDGMVAVADRAALEQVSWMLLDNALKYAPTGAIAVTLEPDGPARVAITVWDQGPGIVPEERARVFRRFERGSSSEGIEGTGLGPRRRPRPRPGDGRHDPLRAQPERWRGVPVHGPRRALRPARLTKVRGSPRDHRAVQSRTFVMRRERSRFLG